MCPQARTCANNMILYNNVSAGKDVCYGKWGSGSYVILTILGLQ